MLKTIKVSLKDTFIYGLGNIAVKIVGLILIPWTTNPKYFSINEFGILGVLEISALVLTALMASALPQSLTRWFWDKDFKENQKGIFFMSLSTQVIISFSICFLLVPFSSTLSTLVFSTPDWSRVITYLIFASAIQAVNNIVNTLMRLQSKSVLYSITNLFKLTSVLILTLYFITSRKMGLEGIYLAQVIGNGLVVLFLIGYSLKNCTVYFDKTVFRSMSIYGFPLYLANISSVILNVVDRYSLITWDVLKSVALYTLASKITSVLKLVIVDSMKLALGPMMLKRIGSPDIGRFYSKVLLYSSFILMFTIIGVSLFSFELIKVIAKSNQYWGAVTIIPVLSISILFISMKDFTIYGLHVVKKTKIIGILVIVSTAVSIGFNYLLIPHFGITGAAMATLLSQFLFWLAVLYYSQKAFYVPYEIGKITLIIVVGTILSFSGLLINHFPLLPRLLLKSVSLMSFPFILYLFNFYEPVELKAIRGFATKWSNLRKLGENLKSLKGIADEM